MIGKNHSLTHSLHWWRSTGRAYPNLQYRNYLRAKHWYSNRLMALRIYNLALKSRKYDKVKIHNNCVYLVRRLDSSYAVWSRAYD